METIAVIGKNFGDEGKGLATAYLCKNAGHCLIVKHNGGGQAGHTVENLTGGLRFVHHQIGSGAEYGAATLFADSFHPDLYQLQKELTEFSSVFGFAPPVFSDRKAEITTIDDVLLNMAAETARGELRHGSCGMGINECVERNRAGHSLTVGDIASNSLSWIADRLNAIRENYSEKRAAVLRIDERNPYSSLLKDSELLHGYAEAIKTGVSQIQLTEVSASRLSQYDCVIFEGGQGLLLDKDYLRYEPHLTASKTGICSPVRFLSQYGLPLNRVIYVTRAYVTRHGSGPLPCECRREELPGVTEDLTNQPNEWQGMFRYARHESMTAFVQPVLEDLASANAEASGRKQNALTASTEISLLITHLNETDGMMYFREGNLPLDAFLRQLPPLFQRICISEDKETMRGIV